MSSIDPFVERGPKATALSASAPMRRHQPRLWSGDRFQTGLFLWPTCLFLLVLTLFPFIYSVWLSLHFVRLTALHRKVWAGLDNYASLLTDQMFLAALRNTALLAVSSITVEVVLGFAVAKVFYELASRKWVNGLRSAYLVPMMITPISVGVIANYVFNPQLGVINQLLGAAGGSPVPWFGDPVWARISILLISVWQWTPFVAMLILAGLMSIRKDILEAARVDGARWWHILFRIEIPSVLPIIMLAVILRLIEVLRYFDVIYITTRGGPGDRTMVLTLFTYQQDFQYFQVGTGSAAAVVILILSIIVTTFAVRILRRIENA
ncbi:carbohydrate ABC transporter permease [Rubellimicrobium arenae]|uniref:carbohydrate ABC transporter permease n=1 Tax=Rubellimicrobium arenae TaxID=2817372 RepID=UPI001B31255D|nr:sugar ABC transporter permease [Rubellimicrobium arenae]